LIDSHFAPERSLSLSASKIDIDKEYEKNEFHYVPLSTLTKAIGAIGALLRAWGYQFISSHCHPPPLN
jgi:hypothetical protein